MTNDTGLPEHQVTKEAIQEDDAKPCAASPQPDDKHYLSAVHPDRNVELVHAQEPLFMLPPEQAGIPHANVALYESMTNAVPPSHYATVPHIQAQAMSYYQVPPPSSYYQQAPYATALPAAPAHADATLQPSVASVAQSYAPTTMVYVAMPYCQETQHAAIRHHPAIAHMTGIPTGVTYHQVPMEYASAPVTVPQPSAAPQTTATVSSAHYKATNRQRLVIWNYCQFCQNNKEPEEFYRSHTLRDPSGRVLCPVLRAYNCPLCNNGGGDKAHTKSYCPQLRSRQQVNGNAVHSGRRHNNLHSNHQPKLKNHSQQFQNEQDPPAL